MMNRSTLVGRGRLLAPRVCLLLSIALSAASPAIAGETVTYSYDALGRLIKADQANGGSGHTESFRYDAAGNRTSHVLQGSPNGSATSVIVAPLGSGFVIIPIDRQ